MVERARLEQRDAGLAPVTDGWFVVNVADAPWWTNERLGAACVFEGDEIAFPHVGLTLAVLQPGQPSGVYHRESNQEDFLVLSGECLLLVEGEERPRLHALRRRSPPRRRRRDRDDGRGRGLRALAAVAARAAREPRRLPWG